MKKIYISPTFCVVRVNNEMPIANSNQVTSDGNVELNEETMEEGNGDDAVKANNYSVWSEDWNE